MQNRFMRGLVMGGMIGAVAAMMMSPNMSSRTRKRMYRTGRRVIGRAANIMDDVRDMTR